MKKILLGLCAFVLFCSHVMYLKLDNYFLEPNTSATIQLFNGTFEKSENVIDRDRMLDASLMGNGERIKVEDSQWAEKDSITILNFNTGNEGTWVAGISTAPRSIEMDAKAFNDYLEHEGIADMLESRSENGTLDSAAVEKYSKHVKTIFQVGSKRTDDWQKALGYPIEFVPLENPYDLNTGDSIRVKLLRNGKPLSDQLVYADFRAQADGHSHDESSEEHGHSQNEQVKDGHTHDGESQNGHSHGKESNSHSHDENSEHGHSHGQNEEKGHTHDKPEAKEHSHDGKAPHSHDHEDKASNHNHEAKEKVESHQHTSGQKLRTDANGIVTAALTADGIWYLQTIHLVNTEEEGFTHESNWTTLTFEVTHGHGEDTHIHDDDHEHEDGIPSYVYWIGSILLVGILFFWFNRKK